MYLYNSINHHMQCILNCVAVRELIWVIADRLFRAAKSMYKTHLNSKPHHAAELGLTYTHPASTMKEE